MPKDKYIEMLMLSAQIEALTELPYESVYKSGDKLGDLKMKSAVLMDDLIRVINEKRKKLSFLNGSTEISKLKNALSKYEELIEGLEVNLKDNEVFLAKLKEFREEKNEK